MAEKELRKLKRRELLQMLLMQCEETEKLQQETDEMKEKMDAVLESYERLKKKLDVKDERLNEKDARIAVLKHEIDEMKTEKEAGETEAASIMDAVSRLSEIFEFIKDKNEANKSSSKNFYIIISNKINKKKEKIQEIKKNPFEKGKAANTRKKQNLFRNGQIISMNPGQTANSLEDGSSSAENTDMECGMAAASGDIYG